MTPEERAELIASSDEIVWYTGPGPHETTINRDGLVDLIAAAIREARYEGYQQAFATFQSVADADVKRSALEEAIAAIEAKGASLTNNCEGHPLHSYGPGLLLALGVILALKDKGDP